MPANSSRASVYFPNLNGLRFIAAFMVIISHVELSKWKLGLPHIFDSSFVPLFGRLGVILFFVLSGFLITYLLLHEKKMTQTVSVRNFYIRRILRIWPLYYLIIILGMFILPEISWLHFPSWTDALPNNLGLKLFLLVFFLPNLVYVVYAPLPFVAQTWSIGVEEQFYLTWPVLVKFTRHVLRMLLFVIIFYLAVKAVLTVLAYVYEENAMLKILYDFWHLFCIDCMALGGIMAYLLIKKKTKLLKFFYHPVVQIIAYAASVSMMFAGVRVPFFFHETYAILFAVIILNLAANPRSIINLEYAPLNYLGKISYGLYMYHPLITFAVVRAGIALSLPYNLFFYAGAVAFSIGVSALSYELFEKRFLRAKVSFSKIVSGDNAKTAAVRISEEISSETLTHNESERS